MILANLTHLLISYVHLYAPMCENVHTSSSLSGGQKKVGFRAAGHGWWE